MSHFLVGSKVNNLYTYFLIKISDYRLTDHISDDDDAGENVRKTIVLISKTLAVHVRYNLWCISLPSSANVK